MSKKGGYRIFDFKGFPLYEYPNGQGKPECASEIVNLVNEKAVLLSGLKRDGTILADRFGEIRDNKLYFFIDNVMYFIDATESTWIITPVKYAVLGKTLKLFNVTTAGSSWSDPEASSATQVIQSNSKITISLDAHDGNTYPEDAGNRNTYSICNITVVDKNNSGLVGVVRYYTNIKKYDVTLYNPTASAITGYNIRIMGTVLIIYAKQF